VDRKGFILAAAANHSYCEGSFLEESDLEDIRAGLITVKKGESEYFTQAVIRLTVPIIEKDKVLGAVILYSPILGINRALYSIVEMIVVAGLLSLVIAFLIGIYLSKRLSEPIMNLTAASAAIANGEKNVEVPVDTNIEEINQFGLAFNYMAAKIEENENKMKDFVANVSHELRSPLTAIKGFIQALIDNKGKTEQDRIKFLHIISRETNRLDYLVDDLLTLTKAENDNSEIPDEADSVKIVKEVVSQYKSIANDKGINFSIRDYENIPKVRVVTNELKQIVINLIDNAIKYSLPQSLIEIWFEKDDQFVRISVSDQGYGIPEEDLPRIWDRFYRVDKARSRETGGTGLGLSIVKELVEKNYGTVNAESYPGKGSVFSFTVPIFVVEASIS
jgi:signal transduction histidine kinase